MKFINSILVAFCLLSSTFASKAQTISFSYDGSGNMTQRSVQVLMGGRFGNFVTRDSTVIPPPLNFKIYPNPTNAFLNIEGDLPENTQEAQVLITNMNGQVLKRDIYRGALKTIAVNDLASGAYLLNIQYSKEKKSTYKIIITN